MILAQQEISLRDEKDVCTGLEGSLTRAPGESAREMVAHAKPFAGGTKMISIQPTTGTANNLPHCVVLQIHAKIHAYDK